jgi:TolA-binding protein
MVAAVLRAAVIILSLLAFAGPAPGKLPPAAEDALKRGKQAFADRLPEIAAKRFAEALAIDGVDDDDRLPLMLLLAESQVRAGKPESALHTLEKPLLGDSAEAQFWRGQALAGIGRFAEAIQVLEKATADPKHPFHTEACFTASSLLLAIGDPAPARAILEPLAAAKDPGVSNTARLRIAEIAFDQEQFPAARKSLDQIDDPDARIQTKVAYLDARLCLEEGQPEEAREKFIKLSEDMSGSPSIHQLTDLGIAAALAASGDRSGASNTLIAFIGNHQDSPLLDTAFEQLLGLLPENATPSDPILEQIEKWLPSAGSQGARPVALYDGGAVAAWPIHDGSEQPKLGALALFHLARGLRLTGDPTARMRAFRLMRRLHLEYPADPIARHALLETGRWHLEDEKFSRARASLRSLGAVTQDPEIKAEAAFHLGIGSLDAADPEAARLAFNKAAAALDGSAAEAAAINAGVARLRAGDLAAFSSDESPTPQVASELALERGLLLAARRDPAATDLLDGFIVAHPKHPRLGEARLALAAAAMSGDSPDLQLAAAQLDTLANDPGPTLPAAELAQARTRLAELAGDWDQAEAHARAFLDNYPDDPLAPQLTLRLGQALFRKGDYNDARLVLERLAEEQPTSPAAEAALFLAARSAALSATPQARKESLDLYQRVARINGSLADSARLERARTLIDMGRFEDATKELREWLRSLDPDSKLGFAAGTLLGEALFAMGGNDPAAYEEALTTYRDLVTRSAPESALNHRFRYLLGLTLERLQRPGEALDTYYSLLESAALNPPLEWEWAERAGFRALALLETAQRWPAALRIAERIANLGGPRAGDATDRARMLRLEHMIWED